MSALDYESAGRAIPAAKLSGRLFLFHPLIRFPLNKGKYSENFEHMVKSLK